MNGIESHGSIIGKKMDGKQHAKKPVKNKELWDRFRHCYHQSIR